MNPLLSSVAFLLATFQVVAAASKQPKKPKPKSKKKISLGVIIAIVVIIIVLVIVIATIYFCARKLLGRKKRSVIPLNDRGGEVASLEQGGLLSSGFPPAPTNWAKEDPQAHNPFADPYNSTRP